MQPTALPYAAPSWLTAKRVVLAALLSGPFTRLVIALTGGTRELALSLAHVLIAIPIANWLLRAKTASEAFRRAFVGTVVLFLVEDGLRALLTGTNVIVGASFGVVGWVIKLLLAGAILGKWQAWLLGRTLPFRSGGAGHDALDQTVRTASLWALVPGILVALNFVAYTYRRAVGLPLLQPFLMCIIPLAFFGIATARIRAMRLWIGRVREGREPRWRIVPHPDFTGVAPLETGSRVDDQRILVRVEESAAPYREGVEIPVASLAAERRE